MNAKKFLFVAAGVVTALPLLVVVVLIGGADDSDCSGTGAAVPSQGLPSADGVTVAGFNPKQLSIAKLAVMVGEQRHIPSNGIVAALAAGVTESQLQNYANSKVPESMSIPHDAVGSDYDSVGPWQMRASIWGKDGIQKLMDPSYQVNWFYDQLTKQGSGWESRSPADLAQAVEQSAPNAYHNHLDTAMTLYETFKGSGGGLDVGYSNTLAAGCTGGSGGVNETPNGSNARILAFAMQIVNKKLPYVWGGIDPNAGMDCSGMTAWAVKQATGVDLPHYTGDHNNPGQLYDPRGKDIPIGQQQPGDLMFFGSGGNSHHVGVYAGNGMLANEPDVGQTAKVEPLSDFHDLMAVKRFGGTDDTSGPAPAAPTAPPPPAPAPALAGAGSPP